MLRRYALTILALAWGTASIAIMLAVGAGLRSSIERSFMVLGKASVTVAPGQTSRSHHGIGTGYKISLDRKDVRNLQRNIANIKNASGYYTFLAKIRYQQKKSHSRNFAVAPAYASIHNLALQPGSRFINQLDMRQRKRVIVLGNKVAERLFGLNNNPTGKTVMLDNYPFRVIGVLKPRPEAIRFQAPPSRSLWIPATTYELLNNTRHYNAIDVLPQDLQQIPALEQAIRQNIALRYGLDPNDKQIVNFRELVTLQQKANRLFLGLELLLGVIGSITLLIAGVGISNVMYASIKQQTPLIGLRMAIGARRRDIVRDYLLEAGLTTLIGGGLGLLISAALVLGLQTIPIHNSFWQSLGNPRPILSWAVNLSVVAILGGISLLAGWFPARYAARIDPAVALRSS